MSPANQTYVVDCTDALELKLDMQAFCDFVKQKFKVNHRVGQMGDKVTVTLDGNKLVFTTKDYSFSKKYVKYLTKKFLSQDYAGVFRVLTDRGNGYSLRRYFADNDEEEEKQEEEKQD